ncbi:MAG TPA: hypothetical protein VGB07_26250 [Blastocatellia bacterium]
MIAIAIIKLRRRGIEILRNSLVTLRTRRLKNITTSNGDKQSAFYPTQAVNRMMGRDQHGSNGWRLRMSDAATMGILRISSFTI